MGTRALIFLSGLWLVAAGVNAQLSSSASGLQFIPRFTRLLKQDVSSVASYLLPTALPTLCANNCCQEDSYASPYGLTILNHTQQIFGGRTYTTFFLSFHSNHFCNTDLDSNKCCTASADNIWVDVDPTLKVKYVAWNGQRLVNSEQNEYGLKLGAVNLKVADASNGIPLYVTVEGAADTLCPPPGLAPLAGLCEIVVQGTASNNPNACCPRTITIDSKTSFPAPNDAFQCSASLDNSPFKLVLDSVSTANQAKDGTVDYNFRLVATDSCSPDGTTNCCDAQLSYIDLKVTDLKVVGVVLGDVSVNYTSSSWNEPNSASYRSLLIDNLNLVADDLEGGGMALRVTVQVPSTASSSTIPDLCDASSVPTQGGCSYYLHSEDGFCCPSGLALLSDSLPEPPAGTCRASEVVPAADTSMSLSYYERIASAATTTFSFLLANHNPISGCTKHYCVDICSWTLYLDPTVASTVAVGHENPANNGRYIMQTSVHGTSSSPIAALTFTYGPAGESTNLFFVTMPAGGKRLTDLCARNALPGQEKSCAAIVRSSTVQILVFFDDSEVILVEGARPPPPAPAMAMCSAPRPMSDSCFAIKAATYNTMPSSAVFQFDATPAVAGANCVAPSVVSQSATVHVLLSPATVDQLTTRGQVRPSTGLVLDRSEGARWSLPTSAAAILAFQVQGPLGPASVCLQGVTDDQPANTCVVEVSGDSGCFRGYVAAAADSRLTWIGAEEPGKKGVSAAVVVPAVVVPLVVLLAALVLGAILYRRRKNQQYFFMNSGSDGLDRPLATQSGSHQGSIRDDLSAPSATASDVQIRVPGASQGGAAS